MEAQKSPVFDICTYLAPLLWVGCDTKSILKRVQLFKLSFPLRNWFPYQGSINSLPYYSLIEGEKEEIYPCISQWL